MSIRAFLEHIRGQPDYAGQMVHVEEIPPRAAQYRPLSGGLQRTVVESLQRLGISQLYSHQAFAVDAAREGQNVITVTGTASGKTLCYNVPVLDAYLREPRSRALYLFPTKALAQDQLRTLGELTQVPRLAGLVTGTYDGDTDRSTRAKLRRRASILLTNPDMLHLGILPNHTAWSAFLRNLRFVVLDEAHVYRGIFGSHVACVLRRLRRVCALHGGRPQFILCSATIANPQEHAERLVGEPFVVVDEDGAPSDYRHFVVWNPPLADRPKGGRKSANSEATWLFTELVKAGLRNITFTPSRKVAELIYLYALENLRRERPDLAESISSYRGGYMPQERRDIERRLFDGELLGVTATNALELGIDVGHLDATVLVGYPGTIASTWQQAGRAGRGRGEALSVLIGHDDPLDQFFMRHPEELFGRPHEHALIDPGNPHVLRGHLPCAAHEKPLEEEDAALFGDASGDDGPFRQAVADLEAEGTLEERSGRWCFRSDDYPAASVNLRSAAEDDFFLLDETQSERVLERVDAATAFFRIYPGAIHLHRGDTYLVSSLDLQKRIALARPADVTFYTQPRELNDVRIVRSTDVQHLGSTDVFFGRVRVTEQVISFMRKQRFTEALLSEESLDLPPRSFETQSLWFEVPEWIGRDLVREGNDLAGALHALEHACIGLLPLFAMCDRNDIGGVSTVRHPDTDRPQVFIYDAFPGGVGIARKGFDLISALWERTLEAVRDCPCEDGCPSCIQSPKCGNNNEPLDKAGTVLVLRALLRGGQGAPGSANHLT